MVMAGYTMYGGVLLKILSFLFFLIFCGFWIWNLLEDQVIGVVVCGSGCNGGCCCDGGCSGGCWFLIGGDYLWAFSALLLYIAGF